MTHSEKLLADLVAGVVPTDRNAREDAQAKQRLLTKPLGSLGQVEDLGAQLAAIARVGLPPRAEPAAVAVFVGDHGVHAEGVSPWPQEVTLQMVLNFCSGGAAINVIAEANGIRVVIVNAGVAGQLPPHHLLTNTPIRAGTGNIRVGSAMSRSDAVAALSLGAQTARRLVADGARCLITGDMGIANTTPSTALIASITGEDPARITGRGTGIDDEMLLLKTKVVGDALARIEGKRLDGVALLSEVGGLEIAALAGFCLAGAGLRVPVLLDGVISLAGALVAYELQPLVVEYLIAGHRSVEPAASAALGHLKLEPLIDLSLRLGEGSGAALAYPMVRAAARIMANMATFDSTGIDGSSAQKPRPRVSRS